MKIDEDLALLLTATIDIKGMPKAYPTAAEQRQEDYYNSVKYYVNNHPRIKKIVFVENSNYSLDRVKEAAKDNPHNKQIEFISLNCNDFPRFLGKGYGESVLIEKGIQQSKLIETVTHVAKITGRIYLLNITEIIEKAPPTFDCLCDLKDQGWFIKRLMGQSTARPNSDTRLLVFSKDLYSKCFQPLHNRELTNCFYFELEYYQAIKEAKKHFKVIDRFPIEPKFRGIAGHFGGKDYGSRSEQVKYALRSVLRKVAPWIHL